MIVCAVCGAQNEPAARYCGVCGNVLPTSGANAGTDRTIEARQPGRASGSRPPDRRPGGRSRDPTEPVPVASSGQSGPGVAATLDPATVRVEPGGAATLRVKVVNLSRVVDEFRVEVLGEASAWCQVVPASVSLFPAAMGTVEIHIRPPRTRETTAGALPMGIRVRSVADATKQVFAQGLVEVGVFEEISIGLVPSRSRGKSSAVHELTVENHGNRVARLDITATDPDRALSFVISPSNTQLLPGQEAPIHVRVQAGRRMWRGAPETMPFQVSVNPDIGERKTADASFTLLPILPSWLGKVVLAGAALVAAAVVGLVVLPRLSGGTATPAPGASPVAVVTPAPTEVQGGGNGPTVAPVSQPPPPTLPPTLPPTPEPTAEPTPSPTVDPNLVTWELIGGAFDSSPMMSSWGPGRLDVFGRTADGAVSHFWTDGAGWQGPEVIGPEAIKFKPAAVSWGPGRIDVFAVGTDDQMYHKSWDGFVWSGWTPRGGLFVSAPAVTSWGPGRLDVFARGLDNAVYHLYTDDGVTFVGWNPVSFDVLEGNPAAVARGVGRIDVFARGTDDQLYQQRYDGVAWLGWFPVPGMTAASGPAATWWAPDRLDLLVRNAADDALWHTWADDGLTWNAWEQLGSNQLTADPAAVAWGAGRLDVTARLPDEAFHHRWYEGGWFP